MTRADARELQAAFDDHVRHEMRRAETELLAAGIDIDVIDRVLTKVAAAARSLRRRSLGCCGQLDRRTRLAGFV